jgi:glyoxylate reductase
LLKTSDVLSLNLPLNPKTRHIISTKEFKLMKPSCVIINTARGAVIDEAELVKALEDGTIAGAGLDVFEEEPKIHPGLVENDKVIDNIRSAVQGKGLMSMIPEQKDAGLDKA